MHRQSDRRRRVLGAIALMAAAVTLSCANPNTPSTPPPPPPDPAALEVICPQPVTGTSLQGDRTVAVCGQATATSGAPPVTVSCKPESGAMFPVGTSMVECVAT